MRTSTFRGTVVGVVALAVFSVAPVAPVASASPGDVGPSARITSQGGLNVVPTPSGLGLALPNSTELLLADCKIGDGCAARDWQVDTAGANRRLFVSNIAWVSSTRLAHRFLLARAQTYRASSAFTGTVKVSTSKNLEITKIDGHWYTAPFRRVLVRDGRRLVLMEVQMLDGQAIPAKASMANLIKKARQALGKSWQKVTTSALPGGYVQ